jgi:pyruvate/2-oxoglutarate dehydrogenase complex dihydrolipoamide dehydrogenase (E3) component
MRGVLRTLATDEAAGFMKVLVAAQDDQILGFTMIGSEAGEVMTVIQAAILADLPYTTLRDAVLAHLTIAEGLGPLFESLPPQTLQPVGPYSPVSNIGDRRCVEE